MEYVASYCQNKEKSKSEEKWSFVVQGITYQDVNGAGNRGKRGGCRKWPCKWLRMNGLKRVRWKSLT